MRLTGGRVFDPLKGFVLRDVCVEDGVITAEAGGGLLRRGHRGPADHGGL